MKPELCVQVEEAAQNAFDLGNPPPKAVLEHSAHCTGCSRFLRRLEAYKKLVSVIDPAASADSTELGTRVLPDKSRLGSRKGILQRRHRVAVLSGAAVSAIMVLSIPLIKNGADRRLIRQETAAFAAALMADPLLQGQPLFHQAELTSVGDPDSLFFKLDDAMAF